jgi:hypothetical protein
MTAATATLTPVPAPYLRPLLDYARLEIRRTLRDPGYVITSVAMPLAMYLLLTDLGAADTAADEADYARYSMIGMATYGALNAALGIGPGGADDNLSVVGGLWFPVSLFPGWLAAISRWTPTRRFGDLGWRVLAHRAPGSGR